MTSGEPVLLDSVILIDHLNGIESARRFLGEIAGRAQISAITRAEVLAGYDDPGLETARSFLDTFPLIPIDREIADLAASLRRTYRWRLPDALQAAVATRHGLLFVTRNTKDFPPSRFPFVRVPYVV